MAGNNLTKEQVLQNIQNTINELKQYRQEVYDKINYIHMLAESIYPHILAVLKDFLPDNKYVIHNICGRKMLGVNMAEKNVVYPKIHYIGATRHYAPPFTIREKDLIPVDVFEWDIDKINKSLKFFSLAMLMQSLYLRAPLDEGAEADFQDARHKYYLFQDYTQPTMYEEDLFLAYEETPEGKYYRAVPYIFNSECCLLTIHTLKAGGYSLMLYRDYPYYQVFVYYGRFILKDMNNVCTVKEYPIDAYLVYIPPPPIGYDVMFTHRKLEPDTLLFIVRISSIFDVVWGEYVHENTYTDTAKRQEYLRKRLAQMGYFVSIVRGGTIWVGQGLLRAESIGIEVK